MNNKNGGANSVGALVAGAAVGIGVAVAGALALSDDSNRKKMKKVFDDLREMGDKIREDIKDDPLDQKVADIKEEVDVNKSAVTEKLEDKK